MKILIIIIVLVIYYLYIKSKSNKKHHSSEISSEISSETSNTYDKSKGIMNPDYYIKPSVAISLYQMMKDTHDLFINHEISYWIDAGTLLGSVRHGGLIPWDDDLDISIDVRDEWKLKNLVSELNKLGYSLVELWFGYKIFLSNGTPIKGYNWKYPFLDIYVVDTSDGYKYTYPKAEASFGKYRHEIHDLYPLKLYKFGSYYLYGPKNPYPYLFKGYGSDVLTHKYKHYDHMKEEKLEIVKEKIDARELIPAQPINKTVNRVKKQIFI